MPENYVILPETLWDFAQERVAEGGYESVSAYVAKLVDGDRRERARMKLEADLLKALESGPATEMTPDDWRQIREEVERRLARRTKG